MAARFGLLAVLEPLVCLRQLLRTFGFRGPFPLSSALAPLALWARAVDKAARRPAKSTMSGSGLAASSRAVVFHGIEDCCGFVRFGSFAGSAASNSSAFGA